MGTGTITKLGDFQDRSGSYSRRIFKYTGSIAYATGGDTFNPEAVGLGKIEAILGLTLWNGSAVLFGFWDQPNKKILWYSATSTQVTNGTDISAYVGYLEVIGK